MSETDQGAVGASLLATYVVASAMAAAFGLLSGRDGARSLRSVREPSGGKRS